MLPTPGPDRPNPSHNSIHPSQPPHGLGTEDGPKWAANRVGTTVRQYEGPMPNCSIHRPKQLAIDYRSEERSWIQRRPPWKGGSTHLQRRGSHSHHKHPTRRPQHPEPVQGRRPSHRSHSQRVAHVRGKPTCSGYCFKWYHHSRGQGSQGHEEGPMQEQPCRMPGGVRKEAIQKCCRTEDAAWSSWASKFRRQVEQWSIQLHPLQPPFTPSSHLCGSGVQVVRSALLTHAAATSFAASLLFEDLSPHHNLDGDSPALPTPAPPCPASRLPAR